MALLFGAVFAGQPLGLHAEVAPTVPSSGKGVTCAYEGRTTLPPDLVIEDLPTGGKVIGRFTGGPTALRVGAFPPGGPAGRARVVVVFRNLC